MLVVISRLLVKALAFCDTSTMSRPSGTVSFAEAILCFDFELSFVALFFSHERAVVQVPSTKAEKQFS